MVDCGQSGYCKNRQCVCHEGWTGAECTERTCLSGCVEHGTCHNGTCVCTKGWNGESCLLTGCLNNCHDNGECKIAPTGEWVCQCNHGFRGQYCSIPVELNCADGQDDDGDNLKDCEDSECCSSPQCIASPQCSTVADPLQVRMRKIPPPSQASFSQKMQFLLEPESVHQYPLISLFNESRISVIRGRVLDSNGSPLQGVRIFDTANALYGFTISRNEGDFDLVVNGGGSITLQFMRQPFNAVYRTFYVPWNQLMHIGECRMSTQVQKETEISESSALQDLPEECRHLHDENIMQPMIIPSWKFMKFAAPEGFTGVLIDSQVIKTMSLIAYDIFYY